MLEDLPPAPRVSVILRSYNRQPALVRLLRTVLAQKFTDFEVLVVEQTTRVDPDALRELEELARDPRVRFLYHPPLGGPGSRNVGARAARGQIHLLMDDDDIPLDDTWIDAHLKNYNDPDCLAVTGRWIPDTGSARKQPYRNMDRARRQVLSYVPVLMYHRVFAQVDQRRVVHSIHGGNVSIRRSALERFGLWDECTTIEDELSLCYRMLRRRRPGEHCIFDPTAVMIRSLDMPGGEDNRFQSLPHYAWRQFEFLHNIIGHYFPIRFVLLYPAYVVLLVALCLDFIWSDFYQSPDTRAGWRALATARLILGLPFMWPYWAAKLIAKNLRHPPVHDPRL